MDAVDFFFFLGKYLFDLDMMIRRSAFASSSTNFTSTMSKLPFTSAASPQNFPNCRAEQSCRSCDTTHPAETPDAAARRASSGIIPEAL
jgi:hypothetical protein